MQGRLWSEGGDRTFIYLYGNLDTPFSIRTDFSSLHFRVFQVMIRKVCILIQDCLTVERFLLLASCVCLCVCAQGAGRGHRFELFLLSERCTMANYQTIFFEIFYHKIKNLHYFS